MPAFREGLFKDSWVAADMPPYVFCPTCTQKVAWIPEESYRPFCSERCKLIDLGEWATEGYVIPEKDSNPDQVEIDLTELREHGDFFE